MANRYNYKSRNSASKRKGGKFNWRSVLSLVIVAALIVAAISFVVSISNKAKTGVESLIADLGLGTTTKNNSNPGGGGGVNSTTKNSSTSSLPSTSSMSSSSSTNAPIVIPEYTLSVSHSNLPVLSVTVNGESNGTTIPATVKSSDVIEITFQETSGYTVPLSITASGITATIDQSDARLVTLRNATGNATVTFNGVVRPLIAPQLSVSNNVINVSSLDSRAEQVKLYIDGVEYTTVSPFPASYLRENGIFANGIDPDEYLSGLSNGQHSCYMIVTASGMNDSQVSNSVFFNRAVVYSLSVSHSNLPVLSVRLNGESNGTTIPTSVNVDDVIEIMFQESSSYTVPENISASGITATVDQSDARIITLSNVTANATVTYNGVARPLVAPQLSVSNNIINVTSLDSRAEQVKLFIDGVEYTTVSPFPASYLRENGIFANGIDPDEYLSGLSNGQHSCYMIVTASGLNDSQVSNSVFFNRTVVYSILTNYTNVSDTGSSSFEMTANDTASVEFSAHNGYRCPETIIVNGVTGTQGTDGVTWSYTVSNTSSTSVGLVSLSNPTGNVNITVVGVATPTYSVEYILSNATKDYNTTSVIEGETFVNYFRAASGYELPNEITVNGTTVGDSATVTPIGSARYQVRNNGEYGVLQITNVTGNVTITATCPASAVTYTLTNTLSNVTVTSVDSTKYGTLADIPAFVYDDDTLTIQFTANSGYNLPSSVTVNGYSVPENTGTTTYGTCAADYGTTSTTGTITLTSFTGAVSFSVSAPDSVENMPEGGGTLYISPYDFFPDANAEDAPGVVVVDGEIPPQEENVDRPYTEPGTYVRYNDDGVWMYISESEVPL